MKDKPTVILIKTVKGDGMDEAAEGRNTAHQKKNLKPEERVALAKSYNIPITEEHGRWNRRNPEQEPRKAYLSDMFDHQEGVFVAATDYMSSLARGIEQWVPGRYEVLGTDGYGLSESRDVLRDHFEVSDKYIAQAALYALYKEGRIIQDSFNEHVQAILGGSGTNA